MVRIERTEPRRKVPEDVRAQRNVAEGAERPDVSVATCQNVRLPNVANPESVAVDLPPRPPLGDDISDVVFCIPTPCNDLATPATSATCSAISNPPRVHRKVDDEGEAVF
jgi:hypothetical protein